MLCHGWAFSFVFSLVATNFAISQLHQEKKRKEKKRKEKTTPFGVNLMRSQVLYRAAQNNCINNLTDDERLIKCAFVEGVHDLAYLFGSHKVHIGLQGQSVGLSIEDDLDVSTVIGNAKNHCAQTWHQSSLSSVVRYQPLQPEYVPAPYLSAVKNFKSRNSSADLDVEVMVFM